MQSRLHCTGADTVTVIELIRAPLSIPEHGAKKFTKLILFSSFKIGHAR